MPGEILSLAGALAVIAGVLVLAWLFTRCVAGRAVHGARTRGRRLNVLEQLPVGKDQRLLVVRVGEAVYLLGASSGSITLLCRLEGEQAGLWDAPPDAGGPGGGHIPEGGMPFRQALERVLAERKNGRKNG